MENPGFEYGPVQIVLTVVVSVIVYVFYAFTLSKIFAKAGVQPWQAWVPFLNSWRLLQLGGQPGWWLIVALVPLVGQILYFVMHLVAQIWVGRGLGKSDWFALLALFLPPVWFLVLAFDSSVWRDEAGKSRVPQSARV